jgi:signal transduction histidine kinase
VATKVNIFIIVLIQSFWFPLISQTKISDLYKKSYEQFKIGKYDDALITNISALKLAEKSNSCDQIAFAYLQVGKMQYYNKERRQALFYFFKSKSLADSCKIDSIQHIIYHNIGAMYVELRINDSALIFLHKASDILQFTNKFSDISKINAVIADLHLNNTSDYVEAEKYILTAEHYAYKSNNKIWIAFAKMKRGILYVRLKNYHQAIKVFQEALNLYDQLRAIEGRLYAMRLILDMKILLNSNDTREYASKYMEIKDSVYRAEGANKIAEYKTIYETEKKEQENKLLQQENSLNQAKLETRNRTIIILVFAIILIVVIVVWRINASKLKKKQLELEASEKLQKEKERISRDLHDNVGGQLSYVLYSLDDIDTDNVSKRKEIKSNINESVRSVIQNLRETIWAINDESLTINDLSDKLKVYARSMFKNSNTKIIFSENIESDILLNSLVGLNLYRICQEIINNAFKYSNATELKISIHSNEKVTIVIADNGNGFDLNEKPEGFGLKNINDRAHEIGAAVTINASKNNGVNYTIVV